MGLTAQHKLVIQWLKAICGWTISVLFLLSTNPMERPKPTMNWSYLQVGQSLIERIPPWHRPTSLSKKLLKTHPLSNNVYFYYYCYIACAKRLKVTCLGGCSTLILLLPPLFPLCSCGCSSSCMSALELRLQNKLKVTVSRRTRMKQGSFAGVSLQRWL